MNASGDEEISAHHRFIEKFVYKNSPFWTHATQRRLSFHTRFNSSVDDAIVPNPNAYYNLELMQKVLNVLCAYLPLYSNLLLKKERYASDVSCSDAQSGNDQLLFKQWSWTEGHTERWMRTVKDTICGSKCMPLANFIDTMKKALQGRVILFKNSLPESGIVAQMEQENVEVAQGELEDDGVIQVEMEDAEVEQGELEDDGGVQVELDDNRVANHRQNVCSPMEVEAEFSTIQSQNTEVKNKGHRHSLVNPGSSFLRGRSQLLLLPNGGSIVGTQDTSGKRVRVRCVNTCTADNFLMAIYSAYKYNSHFRQSLCQFASREQTGCNLLFQFCEGMLEASTSYQIKVARWKLLMQFPDLWSRHSITRITPNFIQVDLEDSEQDIVRILWSSMGSLHRQQTCSNAVCRFASSNDTTNNLVLPPNKDLATWLQQLLTVTEVADCTEPSCEGIRTFNAYIFCNGLPPVLVVVVMEGAATAQQFPTYLHCPHRHPREQ